MNYELAKKLKEAGFPLRLSGGEYPSTPLIFKMDDGNFYNSPTLSELIKACGGQFSELGILGEGGEYKWYATDSVDYERNYGSTSEESVAKLWIALNKKVSAPSA